MIRTLNVCGTRPNIMKIASLMRAYEAKKGFEALILHTGQHYDASLSDQFFADLGLPRPDVNLGVGSGSQAAQTAEIMKRFEPVVLEHRPDWVVVVGDVNSTLACGLAAAKLGVRVAHVEAGLRSFDRSMPEEINRVVVDAVADRLFVSEPSGVDNLRREGIAEERIHFVGNVMIDTLRAYRQRAEESDVLERLGLAPGQYNVVTLHRPSNVDDAEPLERIADALEMIQADRPTVFPMHPRTRTSLVRQGLDRRWGRWPGLRITEPLGYLDFLKLMGSAAVVLTDSGGIQEETTILGVWCLTLRENTERPITLTEGTNTLVGTDVDRIMTGYRRCRETPVRQPPAPAKWDGRAAERIVDVLAGGSDRG